MAHQSTDQCEEAEPGGPGVARKDGLEFVEEGPLLRASLPFEHRVVRPSPVIFTLLHFIEEGRIK